MDQHLFLEPHHCTYGEEEPAALHSWMAGLYLRRERPLLMLLNESGPGRPACWGRAGGSQSLRREPPPAAATAVVRHLEAGRFLQLSQPKKSLSSYVESAQSPGGPVCQSPSSPGSQQVNRPARIRS